MHQLVVLGHASFRIENGDVLKTRMKITTYQDHPDSFLPLTLVSNPTTVYRDAMEPSPLSNQPLSWRFSPGHDDDPRGLVLIRGTVCYNLFSQQVFQHAV
jgi:hypothetical protein